MPGDIAGDSPVAGVVVSPPPQAVKVAAIPKAKSKPIAILFIEFLLVNRDQRQSLVTKNHHADEKTSLLYQPKAPVNVYRQIAPKS
jgi:hypothetical protein